MEKFDILLWTLSFMGILALYWALSGQWKYNKMMRQAQKEEEDKQK